MLNMMLFRQLPACQPTPLTPHPKVTWDEWKRLLVTPGTYPTLLALSQLGEFEAWLPEWCRQRSAFNTQHIAHEFTLERHSLKVLEGTKQSRYYALLTPHEQWLVVLAALCHDLSKNGGPAHLCGSIRPDFYHPEKSVMLARKRLPFWGVVGGDLEIVARLVRHHQWFGRWLMRYGSRNERPPLAEVQKAALVLRHPRVLAMLLALTEGDIRGVKAGGRLFDRQVQRTLPHFAELVHQALAHREERRVNALGCLPQHPEATASLNFTLPQAWHSEVRLTPLACACGAEALEDAMLLLATPLQTNVPTSQGLRVAALADNVVAHVELGATWLGYRGLALERALLGWPTHTAPPQPTHKASGEQGERGSLLLSMWLIP
jgi:hypothetical protein